MFRGLLKYAIIMSIIFLLNGCGEQVSSKEKKDKPGETIKTHKTALAMMQQRRLSHAVMMVRTNVGNIQESGGYQIWTATKMVRALIRLSEMADAHVPGEPRVKQGTPNITYVKHKVSKPWEIVLIPYDKEKKIVVKAYGKVMSKPAIIREIRLSPY